MFLHANTNHAKSVEFALVGVPVCTVIMLYFFVAVCYTVVYLVKQISFF